MCSEVVDRMDLTKRDALHEKQCQHWILKKAERAEHTFRRSSTLRNLMDGSRSDSRAVAADSMNVPPAAAALFPPLIMRNAINA